MASYPCPKGHLSNDQDFCSECGAKIAGVQSNGAPSNGGQQTKPGPALLPGAELCPVCGALHEGGSGIFCEICGYNFQARSGGQSSPAPAETAPAFDPPPPVLPQPSAAAEPQITPALAVPEPASPPPRAITGAWEVEISVDPALLQEGSPEPPATFPPMSMALRQGDNLIGRTSKNRAIFPEISIDGDDAISHRHALLSVEPDGHLSFRDVGSSNGTRLNGIEAKPLTGVALKDGDEITLGHWTRIRIRAVTGREDATI